MSQSWFYCVDACWWVQMVCGRWLRYPFHWSITLNTFKILKIKKIIKKRFGGREPIHSHSLNNKFQIFWNVPILLSIKKYLKRKYKNSKKCECYGIIWIGFQHLCKMYRFDYEKNNFKYFNTYHLYDISTWKGGNSVYFSGQARLQIPPSFPQAHSDRRPSGPSSQRIHLRRFAIVNSFAPWTCKSF